MKKKIKDLTIEEIRKICGKHYTGYSCVRCPLYNLNLCACFATDWDCLYYEVDIDEN